MHFEILVEGQGDLVVLSILMKAIIGEYGCPHTWKIHKHRGIGQLPQNPLALPDKKNPTLLHNLPSVLRAYGKEKRPDMAVIVLVDLDDREDCIAFKQALTQLLVLCDPRPNVLFRIAMEELEAWLLGDRDAVRAAYPAFKADILDTYVQDSRCGTWELLADAIHPGGRKALLFSGKRSPKTMEQKSQWAKKIAPHMDIERNVSPSFRAFCEGMRRFLRAEQDVLSL
jgi:hypothetical protein